MIDQAMADKPAAKLLWVDLEMTGLNPERDRILEVAAIATDWDFNELARYEGTVQLPAATLGRLLKGNREFWDKNPTVRAELVAQNAKGQASAVVEKELAGFIVTHFAVTQPVMLAGNSIHMDRRFIERQWPAVERLLHYRMLDVTAWKVLFEGKYGKKFAKPEAHRAAEDIKGSIEELKYYLKKVKA